MDQDANARRQRRAQHLVIRKFALGAEPDDDISADTTAEERLAMMWPLAVRAWELSGRPLPEYTRETMPARIVRGRP